MIADIAFPTIGLRLGHGRHGRTTDQMGRAQTESYANMTQYFTKATVDWNIKTNQSWPGVNDYQAEFEKNWGIK